MTFKSITITTLCLAAVALSGVSFFMTHDTAHPFNPMAVADEEADTTIEHAVTTVFNKEGRATLKVVTPKMLHFTKDDMTVITAPTITVSQKPQNVWHIRSLYATALNGIDKIIFHDNVIVEHQEDEQHPVTTLNTSLLTVYPNQQIAETNEAIAIKEQSSRVHAIGMQANLNDGTIKLLSKATEEYAPS